MTPRYTVRRPIGLTSPDADYNSLIVSSHRTARGAIKSLHRQRRGCAQQGGYSQDFIYDEAAQSRISEYDVDVG